MLKVIPVEMVDGVLKCRTTIEKYCPACGFDITEDEVASGVCSDCGATFDVPEEHVAVVVASVSFGGQTV